MRSPFCSKIRAAGVSDHIHHTEEGLKSSQSSFPEQVAALEAAQEVDPVAARIGAANTLVRQRDGSLKAYNTDWSAAIEAVEEGLGGPSLSQLPLTPLSR